MDELPSMKTRQAKKQEQPKKPEAPEETTTLADISPVTIDIQIDVSPVFVKTAALRRFLNLNKRLTLRQAKALRALTNLCATGKQTEAMQCVLDKIADAIEDQHGVTM